MIEIPGVAAEPPALRALHRAGWSQSRRVSVDADLRALAGDGYAVFPAAVEFLRSYSGLFVQVVRGGEPDEIWFSAERACQSFDPEWLADYGPRAGTAMLPMGRTNSEHLILLLGENGRWYGGFDDVFGEMGVGVIGCIENVIEDEGFGRDL